MPTYFARRLCRSVLCLLALAFSFASLVSRGSEGGEPLDPVDQVYPLLDTANSRWFYFSSACRPFGMVNLSPDTETGGAWGSGYRYASPSVKGFSHVHGWQISGLTVMPVSAAPNELDSVLADFSAEFSHEKESISPGYHSIEFNRSGIAAELTSTKRVGWHRYRYPRATQAAVAFRLNGKLGPCETVEGRLSQTGPHSVSGSLVNAPTRRRPKPFTIFFHAEFDHPIASVESGQLDGAFLVRFAEAPRIVMKVGLSYTSIEGARKNLEAESPHWDFDRVVQESKEEWNSLLSRVEVHGGDQTQVRRFYTDLWHALQGRRTLNDVDGAYPDYTGDQFAVKQLPLDENGAPRFDHFNSDSFWGAQWTLNTLWGLAYPDIYEQFVHSLMQYYRDGGLVPRGPSGGNYTYVMTGASSTPFIVSAIQKGIVSEDLEEIYEALKKNHSPGGIMSKAGYEHNTKKGGGFDYYLQRGYVPYPLPDGKFGYHQNGPGLTLEYAYQDWTLAQLARRLGHEDDYQQFAARSQNYRNVYDPQSGWIRPKNVAGDWRDPFDPYDNGRGYVEANAAQATWFVPHDLAGLAELMGGNEAAVEKLNTQFEKAEPLGFTAGDKHAVESHPEYRRIPINYGNQPSIQTAFVFHQLGRPDLAQFWSRKVTQAAFSGLSPTTGYNGDEDQGLMGSLAVLLKIGLFQLTGGTEADPNYQIGSPIFDEVVIHLHPDFYEGKEFTLRAAGNGSNSVYVSRAAVDGKPLEGPTIRHSQIVGGGVLELDMSDSPAPQ